MKTWQKPTPEQVERVVRKLSRPAAYRYFFSGLNNPEWIEPLEKRGFFDSPPAAIRDEDRGTVLLPDWPAARYLARVAPERPNLVAKIVEGIPDTDNQEFYGELIEIALRLPGDLAAPISRRLMRQKKIKNLSFSRAHLVARFIVHLAENSQETDAFKLAAALFGERADEGGPAALPSEKTQLEIWEYTEALKACLPSLVKTNTVRSVAFLCTLIETALIEEGLLKYAAPQTLDMSALRAREIADSDESMALGLSEILAKRLCAAAIEAIKLDPRNAPCVIDTIEENKCGLFIIIALHVLSEVAPVASETAKARILSTDLFYAADYANEYSRLLQKRFGELAPEERAIIMNRIQSGPNVETAVSNYTKFSGEAPPNEMVDMYRKIWLRDRLLWIPEAFRSHEMQNQLSALITEIGLPEPAPPITVSGFYGATSPKTDEEFAVMSPSEILAYLRAWTPLDDPQKSPSRGGLARQLQSVVREKPDDFGNLAHEFVGLPPIYIRHFFWGLDEALTKGHRRLNWFRISELGAWMVSQPRGQESRDSFPFREDENWIGARHAAAHLFSDGLVKDPPVVELKQQLWRVISTLAEDPNPTPAEEERSNLNEWATRSLNTIRGNAIHAVIYYAYWLKTTTKNSDGSESFSFDKVPEVRHVLDEHLDIRSDPSFAVRSIYGQHFALLTSLDAKWAKEKTSTIFPDDQNLRSYWNAAWSTYIKFSNLYNDVFALLHTQYELAVERIVGEERDSYADNVVNRLGAHLMTFYWRGLENLTGRLLSRFMLLATPKERGDALGFVGRSLINTRIEVPPEVKDRLQALWEFRLAACEATADIDPFRKELAAFSYWFSSGRFDDRWGILQLQKVMKLIGECGNSYLVIKRLAEIAPRLPFEAISCLEAVLLGQNKSRLYVSTLPEVATVLDVAVKGADQGAKEIVIRIANLLAEQGDLRFRALADQAKLR